MTQTNEPSPHQFIAANENRELRTNGLILSVDVSVPQMVALIGQFALSDRTYVTRPFVELTEEALSKYRPAVVVSPLFGQGFDAVDVAETLNFAGYSGSFWALAPEMPNPQIVEREIGEFAVGIEFHLLMYREDHQRPA